ncbi:unnamed protein product [Ixodes hexagonus]
MGSMLRICVVLLFLSCLLAEGQAVITAAEFKKRLLSFNPAKMTPQCRKIFKNCSMKMFGLLGLLEVIDKRWEEYIAIPCVKTMLQNNFPDFTLECSRSGLYGQASSIRCLLGPEVTAFIGQKHVETLADGMKCVLDNSLP